MRKVHSRQLEDITWLLLQTKPFITSILACSLIFAVIVASLNLAGVGKRYYSQSITSVRPQPSPVFQSGASVQDEMAPPFDVTDYTLLMTSNSVLEEVADRYNQLAPETSPEDLVTTSSLKRQLQVRERLQVRTADSVIYYPTIELTATSPSPQAAKKLLEIWLAVITDHTHDLTYSAKKKVLEYLEREYAQERENLMRIELKYNDVKAESERLLEAKKLEHARIEVDYARDSVESLKKLRVEWESRIAEQAVLFNIPGIEGQLLADRMKLDGTRAAIAKRKVDVISAQNRIKELERQMVQLVSSEIATEHGGETSWIISLPRRTPLFENTHDTVYQKNPSWEATTNSPSVNKEDRQLPSRGAAGLEVLPREGGITGLRERDAELTQRFGRTPGLADEALSEAETPEQSGSIAATTFFRQPNLETDVKPQFESLTVSSQGQNPIEVLLNHRLIDTYVVLASGTDEIAELEAHVSDLDNRLEDTHGEIRRRMATLKNMEQTKEAEVAQRNIERDYGQAVLKQQHDYAIIQLARDRNTLEEQLNRDYRTQEEIYFSLSRSRTEARLAIANTIDEISILSKPSTAIPTRGIGTIQLFGGTFVASTFILYLACVAFVFFRLIAHNVAATEVS